MLVVSRANVFNIWVSINVLICEENFHAKPEVSHL